MTFDLRHGDCVEVMGAMEAMSVDAVVTDPPYGIRFMGKAWDSFDNLNRRAQQRAMQIQSPDKHGKFRKNPRVSLAEQAGSYDFSASGNAAFQRWCDGWAREALRVLRPGAHLVAFGGTRTYHRLTCAVEDAGFEVRDCLSWLYGSGFPKSRDVSKAIDKRAGHWRGRAGRKIREDQPAKGDEYERAEKEPPVTAAAAAALQGLGTALKPAWEPIVLARKPLVGTVAVNVLTHGTGALAIDPCRIEARERRALVGTGIGYGGQGSSYSVGTTDQGRWPANVVLDEEAAVLVDEQADTHAAGHARPRTPGGEFDGSTGIGFGAWGVGEKGFRYGDSGGASRFFYTAKAASGERHYAGRNNHPTVKPVDLMRWLCRLVTPRGGLILDPFMGSGSTGVAALAEGFRFLGIEREAEYVEIARRRIAGPLFAEQA